MRRMYDAVFKARVSLEAIMDCVQQVCEISNTMDVHFWIEALEK